MSDLAAVLPFGLIHAVLTMLVMFGCIDYCTALG